MMSPTGLWSLEFGIMAVTITFLEPELTTFEWEGRAEEDTHWCASVMIVFDWGLEDIEDMLW